MKVTGGKAIYGAALGVLMLDARFPRIPGDMGNAASWDFPVHYKVVREADPDSIVRGNPRDRLPAFIAAAKELEADGVDGIVTNCGFLALLQADLSAAVSVPVAASSLMQVAMVQQLIGPDRRVGILTISGSTLTDAHLKAAGVPDGTPIGTTEGGREFTRVILEDERELDVQMAEADNVDAARALIRDHPGIGALVLECTNMTPYAAAIRAATGVPVFSMLSFASWFHAGLSPRRWHPDQ